MAANMQTRVVVEKHADRRSRLQSACELPVDDRFLGNSCPMGVVKVLQLIFMCVDESVFSEAAIRGELQSMRALAAVSERLRARAI